MHNLTLEEGDRYYVYIHAPAITLAHELWDEPLQAVSSCSNGIVVDTQAPVAGEVWIGRHRQHDTFRVCLCCYECTVKSYTAK